LPISRLLPCGLHNRIRADALRFRGCGTGAGRHGGGIEKTAVKATSIANEYQWIAKNRPGWKYVGQALIIDGSGKPFDLITIRKGNQSAMIFFDISSSFGK
jgi:hypothetical protein